MSNPSSDTNGGGDAEASNWYEHEVEEAHYPKSSPLHSQHSSSSSAMNNTTSSSNANSSTAQHYREQQHQRGEYHSNSGGYSNNPRNGGGDSYHQRDQRYSNQRRDNRDGGGGGGGARESNSNYRGGGSGGGERNSDNRSGGYHTRERRDDRGERNTNGHYNNGSNGSGNGGYHHNHSNSNEHRYQNDHRYSRDHDDRNDARSASYDQDRDRRDSAHHSHADDDHHEEEVLDDEAEPDAASESDEEEAQCPLCMEELDATDKSFKPCQCGYQVCLWCFHHINENLGGKCPACRRIYDTTGQMAADSVVLETIAQKKASGASRNGSSNKLRAKQPSVNIPLAHVRVLQRNLLYVVGLPIQLAKDELLRGRSYFGKFGKIIKIALGIKPDRSSSASDAVSSRTSHTERKQTCSCYVTYKRGVDAVDAIRAVNGSILLGCMLKATYGTSKYCANWLRSAPCNNPSCLYLHEIADPKDCTTKDDLSAFLAETQPSTVNSQAIANNGLPGATSSGSMHPGGAALSQLVPISRQNSAVDMRPSTADNDDDEVVPSTTSSMITPPAAAPAAAAAPVAATPVAAAAPSSWASLAGSRGGNDTSKQQGTVIHAPVEPSPSSEVLQPNAIIYIAPPHLKNKGLGSRTSSAASIVEKKDLSENSDAGSTSTINSPVVQPIEEPAPVDSPSPVATPIIQPVSTPPPPAVSPPLTVGSRPPPGFFGLGAKTMQMPSIAPPAISQLQAPPGVLKPMHAPPTSIQQPPVNVMQQPPVSANALPLQTPPQPPQPAATTAPPGLSLQSLVQAFPAIDPKILALMAQAVPFGIPPLNNHMLHSSNSQTHSPPNGTQQQQHNANNNPHMHNTGGSVHPPPQFGAQNEYSFQHGAFNMRELPHAVQQPQQQHSPHRSTAPPMPMPHRLSQQPQPNQPPSQQQQQQQQQQRLSFNSGPADWEIHAQDDESQQQQQQQHPRAPPSAHNPAAPQTSALAHRWDSWGKLLQEADDLKQQQQVQQPPPQRLDPSARLWNTSANNIPSTSSAVASAWQQQPQQPQPQPLHHHASAPTSRYGFALEEDEDRLGGVGGTNGGRDQRDMRAFAPTAASVPTSTWNTTSTAAKVSGGWPQQQQEYAPQPNTQPQFVSHHDYAPAFTNGNLAQPQPQPQLQQQQQPNLGASRGRAPISVQNYLQHRK